MRRAPQLCSVDWACAVCGARLTNHTAIEVEGLVVCGGRRLYCQSKARQMSGTFEPVPQTGGEARRALELLKRARAKFRRRGDGT